ncbi:hypothetical protein UlMin_026719 [Ulmus minor]
MFPLHNSKEMTSFNSDQQNKIPQDLILNHASLDGRDHGGRRKLSSTLENQNLENSSDQAKKTVHREIERQRRQEMATLHEELRSLLPLEYIKGKRSISDQMNGAVNYIKHFTMKIKELGIQRDNLIKRSNLCELDPRIRSSTSNYNSSTSNITINFCLSGVEIVYSTMTEIVPLSRVLKLLLGEGLTLVNCVTTKVNDRLLHTIQCEVSTDPECINLPRLQQNLTEAILWWNKPPY